MARIRTLKPEFWQDEKLAPLDPIHRLVFLGLISQADDAGRLVDNIRLLNGLLFPATRHSCKASLEVLVGLGRIERYHSDSGQELIQIVNWSAHQKVVNPSKYTLPGNSRQSVDGDGLNRTSIDPKFPTYYLRPTTNDQRPTTNGPFEYAPEFLEAWTVYPTREGSNPKMKAGKAWAARVNNGTTAAELMEGTKAYRLYCDTKATTGSPYVMQASTFYGPDERWKDDYSLDKLGSADRKLMAHRIELEGMDLDL